MLSTLTASAELMASTQEDLSLAISALARMMVEAGAKAIKYNTITKGDLKLHKSNPVKADLKRRLISAALLEVMFISNELCLA